MCSQRTVLVAQGGRTLFPGCAVAKDGEAGGAPLAVAPVAGSAALWSNCDDELELEPKALHEAEALAAPGGTIAEALADRSKPLKIGLNIWLTDRPDWGR